MRVQFWGVYLVKVIHLRVPYIIFGFGILCDFGFVVGIFSKIYSFESSYHFWILGPFWGLYFVF